MASCDKELRNWLSFLLCAIVVESIVPTRHSDSFAPYISYEIIIPRRLEPETGKAKKEELSYLIKAAGKEHIIRLKRKNNFLVENLPVFTYDADGRKVKSHPYIPSGCYYGGYVEGVSDSLVALSTCFGLRGFLKIRGLNYGMEPLKGSRTFQHLLYLTNKTGSNSTVCGLRAESPSHQAEEAGRGNADSRSVHDVLYIELYIMVETKMFHYEGANETRVIHIVLDTVNMVYTHYRLMNLAVILVGLDIWKANNPIEISRDGKHLLDDLYEWTVEQGSRAVRRDTTHLFAHQSFDNFPWEKSPGIICKSDFPLGIDPYLTRDLTQFSTVVSHMLGHNLGLDHDEHYCFCDEQTNCIMHMSHTKFAMFSNCSIETFLNLRIRKKLYCLQNIPDLTTGFRFKHCGNKVVDDGEQCDCGEEQQCKQCCHPNCTFKAKAVCAREECCQHCQIAPRGTLCRASATVCDLPEYCSGTSRWCPEDMYKQDGTSCDWNGYCYAKKCSTHHSQCAGIFGEEARAAPQSCFKALNMAGNEVGNCGGDGEQVAFVKCKEEDILCGRLHCSSVRTRLDPLAYIKSSVNGASCWSLKKQPGRGIGDKGVVPDGTTCSSEKICMNRTCISRSVLKSECDPALHCHSRGVCNSNRNCHCHLGWAPPDCRHFGAGGSIDSGSPKHAFATLLFSFAFKVGIPVMLVGLAVIALLDTRLRRLLAQCRQRISSCC